MERERGREREGEREREREEGRERENVPLYGVTKTTPLTIHSSSLADTHNKAKVLRGRLWESKIP